MPEKSKPPKPDRKITLVLRSTAGQETEEFNANNKAEKVLDKAIKLFKLDPTPPSPYVLRLEADGRVLDLSETLGDLGLKDGDVVLIQAGQAVDG